MSDDRLCPLCDGYRPESICPEHGVATLPDAFETRAVPLQVGSTVLDRYQLEEVLSRGSLATVYRARQIGVNRTVCIKALARSKVASQLRRFYVEAQAVSRLEHPNIVGLFEFGIDVASATPLIVMEFLQGQTLEDVLKNGALPEKRAARLLQQVAGALALAHEREVLHRDLKPSNLMVRRLPDGQEHVVVMDFGVAKILDGDSAKPLTMPGMCVGTPSYMAPEQIRAGAQDSRTDLYGLGCVLHAMLTGSAPYEDGNMMAIMHQQLEATVPELPDRLVDGAAPSTDLRALHASLLAKDRTKRPASALELARMLAALAGPYESHAEEAATIDATQEDPTEADMALLEATEPDNFRTPTMPPNESATEVAPKPLDLDDAPPSLLPRLAQRPAIEHGTLLGAWTNRVTPSSPVPWLVAGAAVVALLVALLLR